MKKTTLIVCDKAQIIKEIIGTTPVSVIIGQPFIKANINLPIETKIGEDAIYHLLFQQDYRKDTLTQLYSREVLNDAFNELLANQTCFACVMVDIDNLKSINDSHGHLAGDKTLQGLSDYFIQNFRPSDTLTRYGGDEFLLLLPLPNNIDIAIINQRLQTLFKDTPCRISWGLASYPTDGNTQAQLIECADKRMYRMKGKADF